MVAIEDASPATAPAQAPLVAIETNGRIEGTDDSAENLVNQNSVQEDTSTKAGSASNTMPPKSRKRQGTPDLDLSEDELAATAPAAKKPKTSPTPPPVKDDTTPTGFQAGDDAATQLDKDSWPGWCEIESDPAYFSAMTRELGVRGVSVKQAFTMDIDELKQLPQPIYGLIFLFRFRRDPAAEDEETCPENVWFANQMPAQNSCGTLAMFNILMNTENVDLGENLSEFKKFTSEFGSVDKGAAFGSFDFVRRIHNSFAKKMDMLEADIEMSERVERARRKKKARRGSKASIDSEDSFDESAHHFIAFVPIRGKVWKIDGLDAQPGSLGDYDEKRPFEWLEMACTRIMTLMAAYEDSQDYSLLALVQSPLVTLRNDLCKSVSVRKLVESRLDSVNSDWRSFVVTNNTSEAPSSTFLSTLGITEEQLATTQLSESEQGKIQTGGMQDLLAQRDALFREQDSLPNRILMEMENEAAEILKANERRFDTGPVIQRWMRKLADSGYLQDHLDGYMNKKK